MYQSVLAAIAFVLLGTTASYLENVDEFSFSLVQLLPHVLVLTLVAAAAIFAVTSLVSVWIPSARTWLIPCAAVALWIQGAFNVPAYGPLDGDAVEWARFRWQPLLDLAVFAGAAAAFYAGRKRLTEHPRLILWALVLVQLSHTAAAAWRVEAMPTAQPPGDGIYRFSDTQNVILVVLDAFQSDVLQQILERRPAYRDALAGFTYYPNIVGLHPSTSPTIPALFLGEHYRNTPSLSRFRRRVFSEQSILSDFSRSGFQVDLIYRAGLPPGRPELVDHFVPADRLGTSWRDALQEALNAFEFTLFRSSPQILRRALYVEGTWSISPQVFRGYPQSVQHRGDLMMLEQIEQRAHVSGVQPVFKFVHVYTPHLPIVIDADLQPSRKPFDRDAFTDQAEASLKMLIRFLETLQRIGAYDTSRIIVIGDHGRPGIGVRRDRTGDEDEEDDPIPGLHLVMAGGLPLFLAKAPGARGALSVDQAPASLLDVAPSLVDGLPSRADRFAGYSVFSDAIPPERRREFLYYRWMEQGWGARYLDPITIFLVDGHSWRPESWRSATSIRAGGKETGAPEYSPGTRLTFQRGGNAGPFLVSGWGSPERRGRWTVAAAATIVLPGGFDPGRDHRLRLSASPNLGRGRIPRQVVAVNVNGHGLGELYLDRPGRQTLEFTIPAQAMQADRLAIRLSLPRHASPSDLGISGDERGLGIYVSDLVVE